jgi:hypothetical protein
MFFDDTSLQVFGDDENAVQYRLHLPAPACRDRVAAEQLLMEASVHAQQIVGADHLWQEDAFCLELIEAESVDGREPMQQLRGRVRFGDCIEDEWLVVHVLLELTRRLPGVVVEVTDNDGQFLLIEAALALPPWVKPECSDGRVFLAAGQLHILPLALGEKDARTPPSLPMALAMVRDEACDTLASPKAQKIINERVQEAVCAALEHRLEVNCIVPRDVARILAQDPRWIAQAVEAFYARDMISLRV